MPINFFPANLNSLLAPIEFNRPLNLETFSHSVAELKAQLIALPNLLGRPITQFPNLTSLRLPKERIATLFHGISPLKAHLEALPKLLKSYCPSLVRACPKVSDPQAITKPSLTCKEKGLLVSYLSAVACAFFGESQASYLACLVAQIAGHYFFSKIPEAKVPEAKAQFSLKAIALPLGVAISFGLSRALHWKEILAVPSIAIACFVADKALKNRHVLKTKGFSHERNNLIKAVALLAINVGFAFFNYSKFGGFSPQGALTEFKDTFQDRYNHFSPPVFTNTLHEMIKKEINYLENYRDPHKTCWKLVNSFKQYQGDWRSLEYDKQIFLNNKYRGKVEEFVEEAEGGRIKRKGLMLTSDDYRELKQDCEVESEKRERTIKDEHPIQRNIFSILDRFYTRIGKELEKDYSKQIFERWRQGIKELAVPLVFSKSDIKLLEKEDQPKEILEKHASFLFDWWEGRYAAWSGLKARVDNEKLPKKNEFETWFLKPAEELEIIKPGYFERKCENCELINNYEIEENKRIRNGEKPSDKILLNRRKYVEVPVFTNALSNEQEPSSDDLYLWYKINYDWWIKYSNEIESLHSVNEIRESVGYGPFYIIKHIGSFPPTGVDYFVAEWKKLYEDYQFEKSIADLPEDEKSRKIWDRDVARLEAEDAAKKEKKRLEKERAASAAKLAKHEAL